MYSIFVACAPPAPARPLPAMPEPKWMDFGPSKTEKTPRPECRFAWIPSCPLDDTQFGSATSARRICWRTSSSVEV